MKKNITINLCERLFSIDEDAYEMLSTYEQSLRNYFRSHEGGEEIAEDIEARIAELLDEIKAQGTEAININHVTEIIHRLGKPEEMDSLSPDPSPVGEGNNKEQTFTNSAALPFGGAGRGTKRLYRDPYDKKLSGVLSGFAAYFGGDVLWWRIGYVGAVLLCFFGSTFNFLWWLPGHHFYFNIEFWGFALIITYIVLSILMPVAWNPEDRLRMKGKEINLQNLAEEVSQPQTVQEPAEGQKGCIGGFFFILGTLFRWCIYAFGAFIAVISIIGIIILLAGCFMSHETWETIFGHNDFFCSPEYLAIEPMLKIPLGIFVVSGLLFLGITAYTIIHSLLNEFKQMPPMSYRQRIIMLMMWIVGLVTVGSSVVYCGPKIDKAENEYHKRIGEEWDVRDRKENTHDGIYIQAQEWEFLQDNGWRILKADGCNDRLTTKGQYLTDNSDVRYLDCYDNHHRQRYRAERTDTLQPGTYQLTCAARADGTGAFIYAILGDGQPQFKEIPATGDTGGDIWVKADRFVRYHRDIAIPSDSVAYGNYQCELAEANDHKGYGWNRIIFESIRITKPTILRYGLTSDNTFTRHTWLGQWFSATDFEITLVEEAKIPIREELQDTSKVHKGRIVIVRSGETLATIAKRYHTTVKELCRLNHLKSSSPLHQGQKLRVR